MNTQSLLAAVVLALGPAASIGFAHAPAEFLEVFSVEASVPIDHSVELKTEVDPLRQDAKLAGPTHFARSIEAMGRRESKTPAFLNWYAIVDPVVQPTRDLDILDLVRGSKQKTLRIESAEFLLCPSQAITTGTPAPVPHGLDHYKAYRVINGPAINMPVTLTDKAGSQQRQIGKPLYVCIATQQWHHDASVSPTHPRDCFVVYKLDGVDADSSVSTIDQFGLNELQMKKSMWLCVHAAILTKLAE